MHYWTEDEMLHEGAEAIISSGSWLGRPAVMKKRRTRKWRHHELDHKLTQRRMDAEIKLLYRLQTHSISVPHVYDIDRENRIIIMSKIAGNPVIDCLRDDKLDDVERSRMLIQVGHLIRRIHRIGIVHGDLSTNNIIWHNKNGASLIDFGLAQIRFELERFGLDLHVLYEVLSASHPEYGDAMELILQGYLEEDEQSVFEAHIEGGKIPSSKEIIHRLDKIRSRVRYHG